MLHCLTVGLVGAGANIEWVVRHKKERNREKLPNSSGRAVPSEATWRVNKNQRYERFLIVTLFVRQVGYCDEFDIFTQLAFSTNSDVLKNFELSAEHAASEPTPAINKAPAPTINKSGHAVINNINLTLFPGGALGNSTTELV